MQVVDLGIIRRVVATPTHPSDRYDMRQVRPGCPTGHREPEGEETGRQAGSESPHMVLDVLHPDILDE